MRVKINYSKTYELLQDSINNWIQNMECKSGFTLSIFDIKYNVNGEYKSAMIQYELLENEGEQVDDIEQNFFEELERETDNV